MQSTRPSHHASITISADIPYKKNVRPIPTWSLYAIRFGVFGDLRDSLRELALSDVNNGHPDQCESVDA